MAVSPETVDGYPLWIDGYIEVEVSGERVRHDIRAELKVAAVLDPEGLAVYEFPEEDLDEISGLGRARGVHLDLFPSKSKLAVPRWLFPFPGA